MINVEKAYSAFVSNGVDFFAGVPDSLLKNICAYFTDHAPKGKHIITANEGTAVGLAAGYYMGTGNIPLVYMQNSGLGNAVNPLLSLADELVYSLPLLLMIGWRGEPGTKDEPQHKKQGEVTLALLEAMKIPFIVLDTDEEHALMQIQTIIDSARRKSTPHAIVIRKETFDGYKLQSKPINTSPLSREKAMKIVVGTLRNTDVVVSTTGKLSRELFEYRDARHEGHKCDFLTVGSMGHSSSIALGIAFTKPERRVFCFDGDGAFIMHMGAVSNIGNLSPQNFYHILFNNGAHESVGGQPTLGFQINIPAIVKSCGYQAAFSVETEPEIRDALHNLTTIDGPVLLEIKVNTTSREDLGRPTTTPVENIHEFMDNLR